MFQYLSFIDVEEEIYSLHLLSKNENHGKIIFNHFGDGLTLVDPENKQTERVDFDEEQFGVILSVIEHPTKQNSIIIGTRKGNFDIFNIKIIKMLLF